MKVVCDHCGKDICKYAIDFAVCGGIYIDDRRYHKECAKRIALKLMETA